MKRNRKSARQTRTGTSPYRRHRKTPFRYSTEYHAWKRAAVKRGGSVPAEPREARQ